MMTLLSISVLAAGLSLAALGLHIAIKIMLADPHDWERRRRGHRNGWPITDAEIDKLLK